MVPHWRSAGYFEAGGRRSTRRECGRSSRGDAARLLGWVVPRNVCRYFHSAPGARLSLKGSKSLVKCEATGFWENETVPGLRGCSSPNASQQVKQETESSKRGQPFQQSEGFGRLVFRVCSSESFLSAIQYRSLGHGLLFQPKSISPNPFTFTGVFAVA